MNPSDYKKLEKEQGDKITQLTGDRPEWGGILVGKLWGMFIITSGKVQAPEVIPEAGFAGSGWRSYDNLQKDLSLSLSEIKELKEELRILKETPEEKQRRIQREKLIKERDEINRKIREIDNIPEDCCYITEDDLKFE